MKQFLYLDTDIVASIIAQAEKGLITQMISEQNSENGKEHQQSVSVNGGASGSGGFWKFLQAEANVGLSYQNDSSKSVLSSSKQVIEKTLHDAAFDNAVKYINPYKIALDDETYDETGNYVEMERVFTFVDFDYLEKMFSENGVVDYLCKYEEATLKNEFDKQLDSQNRKQRRAPNQNAQKELRKVVNDNKKKYEEAHDVIRAIRAIVPYSRMLISSDGYLAPLNDSYFRTDPSSLGFKYGGEMTCVGLITNFIGEDTELINIKEDIFTGIQFAVNEILRKILPTNKNMICVIHPIAVYYGE